MNFRDKAENSSAAALKFGLWPLIAELPAEAASATEFQLEAARYLIGDLPAAASIGFETAREMLAVRNYVIGLLASLEWQRQHFHPREAMWWVLREAYLDTAILKAIRQWNKDRYFEDRGPARVGATKNYQELSQLLRTRCRLPHPTSADSLAARDAELHAHGLGALLFVSSPTIEYRDGDETTIRRLSQVSLSSRWPWWSYFLIKAPSFLTVSAFCHLRQANRTFAAYKIVRAY